VIEILLKFFNSIQLHYGKLNSVNENSIQLFDEKALIKLSIEHGSVEKIFEFLILKYEKDVDINEEYINKVFSEYKIDIDQANSLLNKLKQPKEPSFSKKALLKTPDFSKSKFEEIAKPSFSNIDSNQIKNEGREVKNDNSKNTFNNTSSALRKYFFKLKKTQKIGIIILGLYLIIFLFKSIDFLNPITEADISGRTYSSGYYYLQFKSDNSMRVYQKSSSSSYAEGCTADGVYSIENGELVVRIIKSYCGSENYKWVSGRYKVKSNKISNGSRSFYR